jgi:signal transduction histidine kinase
MSIAKDLIELHNGTIELLEREGAGVTFCITFPNSKDE